MKRCLIYIDETGTSTDLLEVARQIYAGEEYESVALCFGGDGAEVCGFFDRIICAGKAAFGEDATAAAAIIAELDRKYSFDAIVIQATPFGRMLAPRAAMLLGTGLVADVTAIDRDESGPVFVRPAFSGRIMACVKCTGDGPMMLSVRRDVFRYEGVREKKSTTECFTTSHVKRGCIRKTSVRKTEQPYDIRDSEILISGGAGVLRDFGGLKRLADAIGGQVSASRKAVDSGIAPRSIQVGQSGKTVSPKLYIALGIYGAMQHIEGLKRVEHIISVNINRDAPICSLSDIVVEGDAATFMEKLTDRIEKARNA